MRLTINCSECHQIVSVDVNHDGRGVIPSHGHKLACKMIGLEVAIIRTPAKMELEECSKAVVQEAEYRQKLTEEQRRHEQRMIGSTMAIVALGFSSISARNDRHAILRSGRRFPIPR